MTAYPDQLVLWMVWPSRGRTSRGLEGIRTPARSFPLRARAPPETANGAPAAHAAHAANLHNARREGTPLIEHPPVYEFDPVVAADSLRGAPPALRCLAGLGIGAVVERLTTRT